MGRISILGVIWLGLQRVVLRIGARVVEWLDSIVSWLALAFVGLLGWMGKREIGRIDRLEGRKADREELREVLREIKGGQRDHVVRDEKMMDKLDEVRDRVSFIEGKVKNGGEPKR